MLNRRQMLLVTTGVLVAALTVLFPPWSRFLVSSGETVGFAGYHPVFGNPDPHADSMSLAEDDVWRSTEDVRLDLERLALQIGVLAAVVVLGAISLGDRAAREEPPDPEGWSYHRSRHFDEDD